MVGLQPLCYEENIRSKIMDSMPKCAAVRAQSFTAQGRGQAQFLHVTLPRGRAEEGQRRAQLLHVTSLCLGTCLNTGLLALHNKRLPSAPLCVHTRVCFV